MLFNSIDFLIFYPIILILFYVLPHKFRWPLLLIASYVFYMFWKPIYIVLIILSTTVDYFIGLKLDQENSNVKRKLLLGFSLAVNFGLLFYFKYFNMMIETVNLMFKGQYDIQSIILPMGISFYTFQTVSYSLDVFFRKRNAEKHFGYFALYVTFFPQLVAGPIERSDKLIPQFKKKIIFDYPSFVSGLKLMLWGFFKKLVIADSLALVVNSVYDAPHLYSGSSLLIATFLFGVQIYCDFSGYSDIAIGVAKTLGVKLMTNFRRPYFAKSLKDFWSRWHISLSTWFRDYLYIPLGGSRKGVFRTYLNLLIVFLVSGLWHGASWTFVIWGAIHGIYQVIENILQRLLNNNKFRSHLDNIIFKFLRYLLVMTIVFVSWIYFRADTISNANYILTSIFNDWPTLNGLISSFKALIPRITEQAIILIGLLTLFAVDLYNEIDSPSEFKITPFNSTVPKWATYILIIYMIIVFGYFGETEFIYFQF